MSPKANHDAVMPAKRPNMYVMIIAALLKSDAGNCTLPFW